VLDYIIGYEAEVGDALKMLASRQGGEAFDVPVCVLLIERQRWNRGAGSRADWFASVNRREGDDLAHEVFRYGSSVVELHGLSSDDLLRIVHRVGDAASLPYSDDALARLLARLDRAGRPLYAYMLAQELAKGGASAPGGRDALLASALERDRDRRWEKLFAPQSPPTLADEHPALFVALLATITGRLDIREMERVMSQHVDDATIRRAIGITGGTIESSILGSGAIVDALQPNILGEWFVLSAIERGPYLASLAEAAWMIAPKGMIRFLVRSAQDFPDHPSLLELLSYSPSERAWQQLCSQAASVAMLLARYFYELPDHVTKALCASAASGDAVSMHNLGVYLANGKCAPQDDEPGLSWLMKAAETNSPESMHMISMCFIEGVGAEQDFASGVEWLERAASLDHAPSCRDLGLLKLTGVFVEQDIEGGTALLRAAADKEDGVALRMLGQMFERQNGNADALAEAFGYYRRSAQAGDDGGMFHAARCYEQGCGIASDPKLAALWYERSAELGNEDAHIWWARQTQGWTNSPPDT
jgi:TPR repeat protein